MATTSMFDVLVTVGPDDEGMTPDSLSWITLAAPPSPSTWGNTEPSLITMRLFTSIRQMSWEIKNFESKQLQIPCLCLVHIIQSIQVQVLGARLFWLLS